MPHFINTESGCIISTNYKVMYTTMCHQKNYRIISEKKMFFKTWSRKLYMDIHKHYLIVRNPYRKLISFYQDKFHQHPVKARGILHYHRWENSQKIFFPYLDIKLETSPNDIRTRLINVDFDCFIKLLPKVYLQDPHLWPQYYIKYLRYKSFVVGRINFDKVLKMESEEDMDFLVNNLSKNQFSILL